MAELNSDEHMVVEKSNASTTANFNISGIIAAIALLLLVLGVLKFMGVSPI